MTGRRITENKIERCGVTVNASINYSCPMVFATFLEVLLANHFSSFLLVLGHDVTEVTVPGGSLHKTTLDVKNTVY